MARQVVIACKSSIPTSALGQKQTCAPQKVMSALPPKEDMCGATRDVHFGPIADIPTVRTMPRFGSKAEIRLLILMSAYPLAAVSGSPPSQRTIANNTYFLVAVPNEAIAF